MCPEAFGEEGGAVVYEEDDDENADDWAPNMIYLQEQLENVGKSLVVLSQKFKEVQALILLIGLAHSLVTLLHSFVVGSRVSDEGGRAGGAAERRLARSGG